MWNEVLENLVVVKRSGQRVDFNASKIAIAVKNAFDAVYEDVDEKQVYCVFESVLKYINNNYKDRKTINVEDIQDIIENHLKEMGFEKVFIAFKEYRQKRAASRKIFSEKQQHKFIKVVEKIENESENISSCSTPRGLLARFGKIISSEYAKVYVLDNKYARSLEEGNLYIHNLDYFSLGYIPYIHLKLDVKTDDEYLDELILDIVNSSNEVSSEICINNLDLLLEQHFLNYYKKHLENDLEKHLKLMGIFELINFRKVQEYIYRLSDMNASSTELDVFAINLMMQNMFSKVINNVAEDTKKFINITMYRLFNILRLNYSNHKIFSISIGYRDSQICSFIRKSVIEYLTDNHSLENIHVLFKILPDTKDDYLLKIASIIVNHKNISLSFPKSSFNNKSNFDCEYFSNGMRVYDNINDSEVRSNGRMVVAATSINLARLGLRYLNNNQNVKFYEELDQLLDLAKNELLLAFETLGNKYKENYIALFGGNVLGDERLEPCQKIRKIIKTGVLELGVVGLKECVMAYKHEASEQYDFLIEILTYINNKLKQFSEETKLNFALFESNSDLARKYLLGIDKSIYGVHKEINDGNVYDLVSNAKFIRNYKELGRIQSLFTGGCLSIIHVPSKTNNKKVVELIKELMKSDLGYVQMKVEKK